MRPPSSHYPSVICFSHLSTLFPPEPRSTVLFLIRLNFFAMRSAHTFLFRIRIGGCLAIAGAANVCIHYQHQSMAQQNIS